MGDAMSKFTIADKRKLYVEAEDELLKLSGIPYEKFVKRSTPFDPRPYASNHHIHSISFGEPEVHMGSSYTVKDVNGACKFPAVRSDLLSQMSKEEERQMKEFKALQQKKKKAASGDRGESDDEDDEDDIIDDDKKVQTTEVKVGDKLKCIKQPRYTKHTAYMFAVMRGKIHREAEVGTIEIPIKEFDDFKSQGAITGDHHLVFLSGEESSSALWYLCFKELGRFYRCHFIDLIGFGDSSRPPCSCYNPTTAQDWTMNWFEGWLREFPELTNVEKFYLAGHSLSGYICELFAMRNPTRISKLFLVSPLGNTLLNEKIDFTRVPITAYDGPVKPDHVEMAKEQWRECESPLEPSRLIPVEAVIKQTAKAFSQRDSYILRFKGEKHLKSGAACSVLSWHNPDPTTRASHNLTFRAGYGYIDMCTKDKMCNPAFEFPIGACFGSYDWNGSEGVEEIVKANKFYKHGLSQLYTIEYCGHDFYFENPAGIVDRMLSFFEERTKSVFEPSPRRLKDLRQDVRSIHADTYNSILTPYSYF